MNVLPGILENGRAKFGGRTVARVPARAAPDPSDAIEIGVRPEFVKFAKTGVSVKVTKVSDAGRFQVVETLHEDSMIRLLVPEGESIPSESAKLAFDPEFTQVYAGGWAVN